MKIAIIVLAGFCMGCMFAWYKGKKFRTTIDLILLILVWIFGIMAIWSAATSHEEEIVERTDKIAYEKYHYDPVTVETLTDIEMSMYRKTDIDILNGK